MGWETTAMSGVPPSAHAGALLEIDLDAIAANYDLLRVRHPSGPVAAVVKADGYGLGAAPVAARLFRAGCRHFFVAHLDEALAIRALVPGALLAVLNGLLPGTEDIFVQHQISPVLGSLEEIFCWSARARHAGKKLPALLHVDTGMSRLGLDSSAVATLASDKSLLAGIDLQYVMTHLVSSEIPNDARNARQKEIFDSACAMLPAAPAKNSRRCCMWTPACPASAWILPPLPHWQSTSRCSPESICNM